MPRYDGKLLTIDMTILIARIAVKLVGTVEILDVRREMT